MKQNKYDSDTFFQKYSEMTRSQNGLEGAGEWHELQKMLPPFQGKRVLDLGCGYGWHCLYAAEHGASHIVGTDISEKMLAVAKQKTREHPQRPDITYICQPIEDMDFTPASFDIVLSSLAFHYVPSFDDICTRVKSCLAPGGDFVFSVEHPVFTAEGSQQWFRDAQGQILHWPVDRYFSEGQRNATFLGEAVQKYHRTLTTYLNSLIASGFQITGVVEPQPTPAMAAQIPGMADEMRRPMMLLVSARRV